MSHILVSRPLANGTAWEESRKFHPDLSSDLSYKDVLQYVFDSEECKIDSTKNQTLRKLVGRSL